MKNVILDASTLGDDMNLSVFGEFGSVEVRGTTAPEEVADALGQADIAVVNKVRLTEEILLRCPSLRLICVAATGYDNIDLAACKKQGIAVCNVPGYSTESVAQVTLAMVLSLTTHLTEYQNYIRSGAYSLGGVANRLVPVYHDLSSMTWGVVGYGNIGKKVAAVAKAIGCRVLICREHPTGDENECDIDTICKECDVISLHTPLSDSTRGLIGKERLALMKPSATLINVSRGAVTDEAAVAEAIRNGQIGGFGSDVYGKEPFGEDHPFYGIRNFSNVCLTPHMAWGSFESRTRCIEVMLGNIRAFQRGDFTNRIV